MILTERQERDMNAMRPVLPTERQRQDNSDATELMARLQRVVELAEAMRDRGAGVLYNQPSSQDILAAIVWQCSQFSSAIDGERLGGCG